MRTGNWTEGKIAKLTDRWIAVKIDNRIELCRWTALIVLNGQTDQIDRIDQTDQRDWTDQTGQIDLTDRIDQSDQTDQTDQTGPDTTNSCGKRMLSEERERAPTKRAPVPNRTFSRKTCATGGTKFEVQGSTFQPLQSSAFSLFHPIRWESSHGNPSF